MPIIGPLQPARRKRKVTLRAALRAAERAGRTVNSATVEDGKVTLTFGEPGAANSNSWDDVYAADKKRPS